MIETITTIYPNLRSTAWPQRVASDAERVPRCYPKGTILQLEPTVAAFAHRFGDATL